MADQLTPDVEWMTPAEAANLLRVSGETIRRMVRSGELDGMRIGRQYRVVARAVHDIIRGAQHA